MNPNPSLTISRRAMLRGIGVMMALPFLESLVPARFRALGKSAGTPAAPVRIGVLYMPNGAQPHAWTPSARGKDFELSPVLSPLKDFKQDILVLTQLWNAATNTGDGHYVKTGGFLTGTTITRTTGDNICSGGVSADQIAAQQIGNLTPLPSLELGIEPVTTGVDTNVGFTRLYGSHISWNTPTTPMAKEIDPQLAFDRLFRSDRKNTTEDPSRQQSVIDLVLADAKRVSARVSQADRKKLDEYLAAVRSVEKRIEFEARRKADQYRADPQALKEIESLGQRIKSYYNDPARASERGIDHTEHVRLMLDIMALALWTDSTRVATFMFGNAVSGRNFSFLNGVNGGHHEISHHENKADKLEQYKRIGMWHIEQYAYLLGKLRSYREGESSVLDHSMILFGAGMRDGNAHDPHNLPLVLAGRGDGSLATGRHLLYERNTPLTNLYRGILRRAGAPVEKLADSTGELPGLDDPSALGTAPV